MDQLLSSIPPWLTAGVVTVGILIGAIVRGFSSGTRDLKEQKTGDLFKVKGPAVVDQGSIVSGALAASIEGLSATITIEVVPVLKSIIELLKDEHQAEAIHGLTESLKEANRELDRLREEIRVSREVSIRK